MLLVREVVPQPELGRVGAGPRAGRQRRRRCGKGAGQAGRAGRGWGRGGRLLTQLQLVRQRLSARLGTARRLVVGRRLRRARLRLRLQQLAHGVPRRGRRALQRPPVHGRRVPLQHVAAANGRVVDIDLIRTTLRWHQRPKMQKKTAAKVTST